MKISEIKKKKIRLRWENPLYRFKYLYRSHTELHGTGSRRRRPRAAAGRAGQPGLLLREGRGGCGEPSPGQGQGRRRELQRRSQLPSAVPSVREAAGLRAARALGGG